MKFLIDFSSNFYKLRLENNSLQDVVNNIQCDISIPDLNTVFYFVVKTDLITIFKEDGT